MRILLLGGTGWLGREFARAALARGHDVTCACRGDALPIGVRHVVVDRDDDAGLRIVSGEHWDAVVDVGREPVHVRRAVRDLDAARYLLVSTVSVYTGADDEGTVPALAGERMGGVEDYGPAKVACEAAVLAGFGAARSLIVRPGLIGGPGDGSGRTSYWPWRFAHPAADGVVLVPDASEQPTSIIDVRDLAAWLVHALEGELAGVYDAVGPVVPLGEHLESARAVAGGAAGLLPAPTAWLQEQGVREWMGPRSLPLWIADRSAWPMLARSATRAVERGLVLRPPVETLRDVLAWREGGGEAGAAGLSDADERALIARLRG
ncbi:NAD-dependent epimerase/dehydratase family protein [Microbacterium oryzae]|uniref:NAD-dependent epimerase/dehydratase family protein n=1 Tax=Microbacterium oryzae TaxID=743009 RepID=UPI0025AEDD7C|nr:NAD-dependent epimerase/dehydratase family protein [Microbacterium oryzae]MDN3309403.1 NAD-dependent epimerase/dehydratase family protein [Microbacterium oryzae]